MRTVIANSALHLRLEREGWRTVYLGHGTATVVPHKVQCPCGRTPSEPCLPCDDPDGYDKMNDAERAAISTGDQTP